LPARSVSLLGLRFDDELDSPVSGQPADRCGLGIAWRQRCVSGKVLGEVVGPPTSRVVRVELVCLAAEASDALHRSVERRLDPIDGAFHFARFRRLPAKTIELL